MNFLRAALLIWTMVLCARGQFEINFASLAAGVSFYTTNTAGMLCSGTNYAAAFYYGPPGASADQLLQVGAPAYFSTAWPGFST